MRSDQALLKQYLRDRLPVGLLLLIAIPTLSYIVYSPIGSGHTVFYHVKEWRIRIVWPLTLILASGRFLELIWRPIAIFLDLRSLSTDSFRIRQRLPFSEEHFLNTRKRSFVEIGKYPVSKGKLLHLWLNTILPFCLDASICDGYEFSRLMEKVEHGKVYELTYFRWSRIVKSIREEPAD